MRLIPNLKLDEALGLAEIAALNVPYQFSAVFAELTWVHLGLFARLSPPVAAIKNRRNSKFRGDSGKQGLQDAAALT